MMKYGLFLGCNMPANRPDVERAIRLTMPALGVELVDLEGYVCCPAFGTFPSMDEDAKLAVNAWNFCLGEEKGLDLMVECGSCYSSLRTGSKELEHSEEHRNRANALLAKAGKRYEGKSGVRHITDVLYKDVGVEAIRKAVKKSARGLRVAVQYPCHSLFPSEIVGFEESSAKPHILADLVEALGAEAVHYSREYHCCGGAGGFHRSSHHEAQGFARKKLDSIKDETGADLIVVSCITCLMFLDNVQKDLKRSDDSAYDLPVFDYNQLLALCMGFPAAEVAGISTVPRDRIAKHLG
jgi:heterodisulfide reductase subunit B